MGERLKQWEGSKSTRERAYDLGWELVKWLLLGSVAWLAAAGAGLVRGHEAVTAVAALVLTLAIGLAAAFTLLYVKHPAVQGTAVVLGCASVFLFFKVLLPWAAASGGAAEYRVITLALFGLMAGLIAIAAILAWPLVVWLRQRVAQRRSKRAAG